MNGPLRFRDDAALQSELGLDFAQELRSLEGSDLAQLEASLTSSIAAGAAPAFDPFDPGGPLADAAATAGGAGGIATGGAGLASSALKIGLVPLLVAALILGGAAGAGISVALLKRSDTTTQSNSDDAKEQTSGGPASDVAVGVSGDGTIGEDASVSSRAQQPPEPPVPSLASKQADNPVGTPTADRPESAAPPHSTASPSGSPNTTPPRTGASRTAATAGRAAATGRPRKAPAAPSAPEAGQTDPLPKAAGADPRKPSSGPTALERELALYQAASEALRARDYAEAVEGFRAHAAEHPRGTLRVEARLGLLQAHYRAGDYKAAVEVALPLLTDPAFDNRQREIRKLAETALKALKRCQRLRRALSAGDSAAIAELSHACRP